MYRLKIIYGIKWERVHASEPLNYFIIVIYEPWSTYSYLLLFHDCAFGNGRIGHFTDLLNDLFNRYYKY